ncbi:MAG: M48 family metallopeptidase [Sideroxydans sp.]
MISARYFDGKTTAAKAVELSLVGQEWVLRGDDLELRYPLLQTQISERLGNTPRLLTFADGGHCEVTDHVALDQMLEAAGVRRSWVDGMQHSLGWALLASLAIVAVLIASYVYLLPWSAGVIAQRVPDAVLQKMGSSTLDTLDKLMLQPSKLDATRQQALTAAYAKLQPLPDSKMSYHIVFRSSPRMGPNAFALPDGTIVMLDELVALTEKDDEIVAVLAHERGHIEQRHAMRMVLQSSAVGLVMTWYMGDVSSLLATVPAVILQASYSRDMERESDEYAERTLQLNGLSPCLLATALEKLEAAHLSRNEKTRSTQDEAMDYLSSHPATPERIQQMCPEWR